ncbi:hypothetical protein [Actinomadura litoris]|uniref:hypothetical protein n=1 Tax=Actinomadura litoris TaxID=2678616 RepID=UPI001FA765CE|nr:hypothetical protein [Actinomadura litoris]
MADPLTRKERRAVQLAGAALTAALGNDWQRASAMLQRISTECGGEGMQRALLSLCDTVIHHAGITPGQPVRIMFQQADGDGRITGADEVQRRESVWAGRLLAARAADDEDTWSALIEALPRDGYAIGQHVIALLEMCTLMIARYLKRGA